LECLPGLFQLLTEYPLCTIMDFLSRKTGVTEVLQVVDGRILSNGRARSWYCVCGRQEIEHVVVAVDLAR
jgi:hypothetical protein